MNITIRHALETDAHTIREVLVETWNKTYQDSLPESVREFVKNHWHTQRNLQSQIADGETTFLVALNQVGEIIGLTSLYSQSLSQGFLSRLYVHPKHQRKGVGSKLLKTVLKEAPAQTVSAEVEHVNQPAQTFFEKHGFKRVQDGLKTAGDESIAIYRYQLDTEAA